MDNFTNKHSLYILQEIQISHAKFCKEINKAKNPNKVLCKQCQFLRGFDPSVQAGFDSFNVKGFQETELIEITIGRKN